MRRFILPLITAATLVIATQFTDQSSDEEWPEYLGGPDRNHYSRLTQITPANVNQLQVAWEYHSRDSGQVQCNPLMVGGVLYGITATNQIFALDAATGKERWRFAQPGGGGLNTNRGLTYWQDQSDRRILYASGSYLYALDAVTGKSILAFGDNGRVSLRAGLGPTAKDKFVISNTPGTLFEDLIIMPLRLSEGADAAPGSIQAFHVRTGKIAWVFHTIPQPGEFGYDTWPKDSYQNKDVGAANNWAGMALDRKRAILYVPTGSPAFDFYGGNRQGKNLFANCLLALDARTGKRLWHYQIVHHDVWDRDLPAPPNLVTLTIGGKKIDAVAQVTKTGYVYVFDRVTGKPLFPIDEKPAPQSTVTGEVVWPTQPIPRMPAPFTRQFIAEKDLNPYAANKAELLETYRKAKKGFFQPLSETPTLVFPGADGGAEWGGAAVDPEGIMYVNANEMAWLFSLSPTPKSDELTHLSPGQRLYTTHCVACHGPNRQGNPTSGYPSLINIQERRDRAFVTKIITNGKGMMPGFASISSTEKQALVAFLFGDEKVEATAKAGKETAMPYVPYRFNGYNKFLDSQGYPGIAPPWGTLTAINLNTGKHLWQKTLGEFKELTQQGIAPTGTENYGGPIVTASGLLFIAATKDGKIRAFDKKTGAILWERELPAAGFATPSTYQINGKQYVVVACGGTKLGTKKGDSYIAFALP
ncbi:PQQ-binding-like beta-propeller repeat protein [Siphonobacter sp. SORGH_AS_1065]|uniref:outer membrane protein assembly factor BamB family protein n=1 Tax=Siphonobacter sp. SORGH_AS_1065 TaxID=3041795 RepID=UPI002780E6EA|nr:PQQ-binding-like beta-propeller repeat protein [Siphonobacter sp. SORGH_AS_1065]MDQ1089931.1 quinoprotein glucose dehydrogenase [Siphonobacter sp. SORGH_AS_1065]